jgi:hypothetical protein
LDIVFQAVNACCTIAWLFLLSAAGEKVTAKRVTFSHDYEMRALGKLDALNETLLKIGKS